MLSFERVFEFTVWHFEFNSKLYDVVSWNQSIYVFQCISYIYTVYCIYVDWTYISEKEIQASTLPSCLLFLSCQILWWICRIPLGSMTKQRLPIRSGSAGNLELSWYYWNLLLSSLTSLISHWCPRYGCACVLLFPLCHLADCHRFVARCCKAWLSHSSDRGHSLSQLISSLTCRTVSGWNTTVFSHVTSFHMAGQKSEFSKHEPNSVWGKVMIYSWSISLSWFYVTRDLWSFLWTAIVRSNVFHQESKRSGDRRHCKWCLKCAYLIPGWLTPSNRWLRVVMGAPYQEGYHK